MGFASSNGGDTIIGVMVDGHPDYLKQLL